MRVMALGHSTSEYAGPFVHEARSGSGLICPRTRKVMAQIDVENKQPSSCKCVYRLCGLYRC